MTRQWCTPPRHVLGHLTSRHVRGRSSHPFLRAWSTHSTPLSRSRSPSPGPSTSCPRSTLPMSRTWLPHIMPRQWSSTSHMSYRLTPFHVRVLHPEPPLPSQMSTLPLHVMSKVRHVKVMSTQPILVLGHLTPCHVHVQLPPVMS